MRSSQYMLVAIILMMFTKSLEGELSSAEMQVAACKKLLLETTTSFKNFLKLLKKPAINKKCQLVPNDQLHLQTCFQVHLVLNNFNLH